ncbi:hypothetical protein B9Z55_012840 [Caenorhabditis nigoni]|uniref:PAN-3 domain-containing protein n=1 Tax=Caenorhabditis nigoni TaxID=1611254 RepID=A0A2G5U018_9PELO|nr:hypothetical protein B9Z55_012840 [Caenorhabditis nigoni]
MIVPVCILFFLFFTPITNGTVNMLLFWGYPSAGVLQYCTQNTTVVDFSGCMEACLETDSCMLSYGNDTTCILCDIYTVTAITQTDSSNGIKVAVKVNGQNSCPVDVGSNVYTFTNGNNGYTMTYSNPTWTISITKSCPNSSWRMFARPAGPFCIKISSSTQGVSRNNATVICNTTTNAWLTGFNGIAEFNYIFDTARSLFPTPLNYQYLSVWISGLMRSTCVDAPETTNCTGLAAFGEFQVQTNWDLYKFPSGYPNFTITSSGYYQRCLQLAWSQQLTAYNGMVLNAA